MMTQIMAGLKKEWLFIWRSFRFIGMVVIFLGSALLYPIMSAMMRWMSEAFEVMLEDVHDLNSVEAVEDLGVIADMLTLELTYTSSLGMVASGIVIVMIFLMGAAGGEQKKRSIIIPQTAGLTPSGYVLPKFMLYPPMVFVLTLVSAFATNGVCHLVFEQSYSLETVLLTGSLYGILMMFTVCFYLFLGISLARPGLSVLYVFAANTVFNLMLTFAFKVDRFTPWNLTTMADLHVMNLSPDVVTSANMTATVVITLCLCVAFMLLTLFSMVAKRMDNTADEVF